MALHAWAISLAVGLFFLLAGLFVDEDAKLQLIVGGIFVFVVTPLLGLWRFLMPRSWKRSLSRRGQRRL